VRFRDDPLVTGGPKLRFYAGVPLISAGGHAIGSLAIMDCKPRGLSEFQQEMLHALARQIMLTLEHRSRESQATSRADEREFATLEKLEHSSRLLQIASRMTDLGAWEVDLATQRVVWAEEAGKAHESQLRKCRLRIHCASIRPSRGSEAGNCSLPAHAMGRRSIMSRKLSSRMEAVNGYA
jgi:GAF domain-containing protein